MEINADKLIVLVRARPSLYNYKLKDYSKKNAIDRLWDEIAAEMNASALDCRLKWHNLRCSYSRYLREIKRMSNGMGRNKKKKWRLADSMSFLNEYLTQHKKTDFSNPQFELHCVKVEKAEDLILTSDQSVTEDTNLYTHESRSSSDSFRPCTPIEETFQTTLNNYSSLLPESQLKESYSPLENFFKGLLPDLENLNPRRQRIFRSELVKLVNKLADEEEFENERILSTESTRSTDFKPF